ncbi:hypothetical protein VTI74DRAFT_1712 [Chaetomium olivicolor]
MLDKAVNELRLVSILPNSTDKCLRLKISHVPFPKPKESQDIQPRVCQAQASLAEGWIADEALEGQLLFFRPDDLNSSVSWIHPDPASANAFPQATVQEQPDAPAYEALSYTWGPPTPTETVLIEEETSDPSEFYVAPNLAAALRHLRLPDRPRTLWIDAICINQSDISERGEQVGRMCDIYSMASRVTIWLGLAADNSHLALDSLRKLGSQVEYLRGGLMCPSPGFYEPDWYKSDCELPFDNDIWEAVHHLVARPWFTRLWIIQEAQLANPRSVVQCGSAVVPWPLMRRAIICIFLKKSRPATALIRQMRNAMDCTQFLRGKPVERLLQMSSFRQCSDPRDKIYGMMSVMPPSFTTLIPTDYTLDIAVLYKMVFLAYTESFKRLTLLQQCHRSDQSWPSWVPHWNLPLHLMNTSDRAYCASGVSQAYLRPQDEAIEVISICLGSVQHVQNVGLSSQPGLEDLLNHLKGKDIERMEAIEYLPGCSQYSAYLQALCMAGLQDRFEQPSVYSTLQEWKREIQQHMDGVQSATALSRQSATVLNNLSTHSPIGIEGGYVGLAKRGVCKGSSTFPCLTSVVIPLTSSGQGTASS